MSIRYRSDRDKWEVDILLRGRRKRFLFISKKEAVEFNRECRLGIFPLQEANPAATTIEAGFALYYESESTKKSSRSRCNDKRYLNFAFHFLAAVRGLAHIDDVGLEDLEALRKWLLASQKAGNETKAPWAEATVSRCCATLKRVFRFLMMIKRATNDPTVYWTIPVPDQNRRRPMTAQEFEAIYARSPDWFRPCLKFMRDTGARASSVTRLCWGDVDFHNRSLRLRSKKGPRARAKVIDHPMLQELSSLLASMRRSRPFAGSDDPVFLNASGAPLDPEWVSRVGNRLIADCGFKGVVLYGLRHALATELTEAGVPMEITRQALGHASVQTTQIYARGIGQNSIRDALTKVRGEKRSATLPPNATKEKENNA